MNAAQQELFDLAILRVLDARRTRFGNTLPEIAYGMLEHAFPSPDHDDERDRIEYHTNKGLIEEVAKTVNKANRAWRITEAGINHVDNHA